MPKRSFPLAKVYTLLEPGPVVLVTTASGGKRNVMTMSWQTMLDFEPPLVGCVISDRGHSFSLLSASNECVINIPTVDLANKVVRCGNMSGATTDKFKRLGFTLSPAEQVAAPLLDDCFASLECRVVDATLVPTRCFFILEVVKAWVDPGVKEPKTLHHRGYGRFMVAGETIKLRSKMK